MCSRDRSIRWLRGRGREIRSFPARFMYKELKMLFGGKKPSVRKFNLALRALSLEEQNRYYKVVYDAAFNGTRYPIVIESFCATSCCMTNSGRRIICAGIRCWACSGIRYVSRNCCVGCLPCWSRVLRRTGIWRLSCYCCSHTRKRSTT